jgi:hypothetical protein
MTGIEKHTHTVYAFQRQGKKSGRLLEVGTGRIDPDRNIAHVFMDRQPADSDDVARSFRDHVARCSDMMSPV